MGGFQDTAIQSHCKLVIIVLISCIILNLIVKFEVMSLFLALNLILSYLTACIIYYFVSLLHLTQVVLVVFAQCVLTLLTS